MKNIKFKAYMEELWERHKKYEKEIEKEYKEWEEELYREKKDSLIAYENSINSLETKEDLVTIYSYVYNNFSQNNLHKKLIFDLGDKYDIFMALIKKVFKNDKTYSRVQYNILSNSFSYFNLLVGYFFQQLSTSEITSILNIKDEYKKLYWHLFKSDELSKEYFIGISKNYINEYINLVITTMNNYLIQTNYVGISNYRHHYNESFKKIGIYNKKDLKPIIEYSKKIFSIHYKTIKGDKNTLIEIIAVDKDNYQFILEFLLKDKDNYSDYFESLLTIDINRAIDDFLNIFYPKNKNKYIDLSVKENHNFLTPIYHFSKYDIMNISPIKRKYFKILLGEIHAINEYSDSNFFKSLNEKNIEFILQNYYNFFKQYFHPIGGYTPDIYDSMNTLINKIVVHLGENTKYIDFLEKLIANSDGRLKKQSKRQLENLYNLQLKNRELDSNYYKNILDNYKNTQNRFFDYDKLRDDLIEISLLETEHRKLICTESEDETNDRFRKDLHLKGYFVSDQSRGGESQSTKSLGERDLVIRHKESGVAESIIEAFQLDKSDDTTKIKTHYKKLFEKYDTVGNSTNFILVYIKANNFNDLWKKYKKKDFFIDFTEEKTKKENFKIGYTKEKNMTIYHLFINFYSHQGTN